MEEKARAVLGRTARVAAVTITVILLLGAGSAWAQTRYLGDGAIQNSYGGWDLPAQGTCPAGAAQGYTGIDTRPECVALRLNIAQASCTGNYSWTTSGVCNDLVNTTQVACEAAGDRLWNPGTGVCSVVMYSDDRNNVVCAKHGGTWVTSGTCTGAWVMPARTAYTPELLTGTGPGDQCLRCHNTVTQYNGPRVRDTEDTLYMGHKNMSRPVAVGTPWGGPPMECKGNPSKTTEESCLQAGGKWAPVAPYPSDDSGNTINWTNGTIHVGSTDYSLKWIYGDWLAALPRAIYADANLNNMSYSCGRCHTTGWTSDSTVTPVRTDARLTKEPERTFPGITWDGNVAHDKGWVSLRGGVAGDSNNMSSWDVWGISCTRCHNSAIDIAKGDTSTPVQYSAPTGMSSHHNNLTGADNSSGVCTDTRFTTEAVCTANSGTWITACSNQATPGVCTMAANTSAKCGVALGTWVAAPGWCSNAFYSNSVDCLANGFTWQDGWCTTADAQGACTGGSGDGAKTWRLNGTQQSCQVAAATWSFSKCSVEGLCSKGTCSDVTYTNQVACVAAGKTWTAITSAAACATASGQFAYATDIVRCIDAGGEWTGNNTNRGQIITALCMNCHRQETSGWPNTNGTCSNVAKTTQGACIAAGATWTETGNGIGMLVGPYHSTVTFPSHPHSNQFLNSPHARFTGKWSQIATAKNFAGYNSYFLFDSEAANTGAGCTTCHDVHTSTVTGEKPFAKECTECHAGPYKKDLTKILHPSGPGTPLGSLVGTPEEFEACVKCHMPSGLHLWRINASQSYSTFPMPAAISGNVAPNTAPEGTFTNAVWVDLDAACGQCHGGGSAYKSTTGSITAGSAVLTVASSAGFLANERVRIAEAGSFYYDDLGAGKNTDFDTYVKTVDSATQITLAGTATKTVAGKAVIQNVTQNGAQYFSKANLAYYASGIHGGEAASPVPFVDFTYSVNSLNNLTVNVDGSPTSCSPDCTGFTYSWTWGDGASTTGVTSSHTYAAAGAKTITLTVSKSGIQNAASKTVNVYASDAAPVAGGSLAWNANTWTATLTDASSDDVAVSKVAVNWGDGSVVSVGGQGTVFPSHTYLVPGTFTVTQTVIDSIGQMTTKTYTATPAYFSIKGTVYKHDGTTAVPSATVQVKKGATIVKTAVSAANGTFTADSLKPGTYTLTVSKSTYTFTVPAATVTVGPNSTGNNISALTP